MFWASVTCLQAFQKSRIHGHSRNHGIAAVAEEVVKVVIAEVAVEEVAVANAPEPDPKNRKKRNYINE